MDPQVILVAYSIPESQLIVGPDSIGTLRFDLEAKAADGVQNLDPEQILKLLRSLLEDRFQLKVHRETREGASSTSLSEGMVRN